MCMCPKHGIDLATNSLICGVMVTDQYATRAATHTYREHQTTLFLFAPVILKSARKLIPQKLNLYVIIVEAPPPPKKYKFLFRFHNKFGGWPGHLKNYKFVPFLPPPPSPQKFQRALIKFFTCLY